MGQGQFGHLFGHEGVEGILPLKVSEVTVRLVEGKGFDTMRAPRTVLASALGEMRQRRAPHPQSTLSAGEKSRSWGIRLHPSLFALSSTFLRLSKRSGHPVSPVGLAPWLETCLPCRRAFLRIRWPLGYGPIVRPSGSPYFTRRSSQSFLCVSSPWQEKQ